MRDTLVTVLVSVILSLGGGVGLGALLLVKYQRRLLGSQSRKTDAEATALLMQPFEQSIRQAEKLAQRANDRADKAETEAREANRRANDAERRIARLERLGGLHMIWDLEAQAEVERLGGHLRPPPVLDDVGAS